MTLHIGDTAPDFSVDTQNGEISFHDWADDAWVFFFSHPADFTPVCTTEMGRTAQLVRNGLRRKPLVWVRPAPTQHRSRTLTRPSASTLAAQIAAIQPIRFQRGDGVSINGSRACRPCRGTPNRPSRYRPGSSAG